MHWLLSGWGIAVWDPIVGIVAYSCGWAMARGEWPWTSWRRR